MPSHERIHVPDFLSKHGGLESFAQRIGSLLGERGNRFAGDEHNIALYIQRSKNENVVCYRATYCDPVNGILQPEAPLDAYWLDIDPEYVKANRKSGKMDDRCELNLIDRTMAYGHSPSEPMPLVSDDSGLRGHYFDVSFVALSGRKMHLMSIPHPSTDSPTGGSPGTRRHTPVVLCHVNGSPTVLHRIFVKSHEPKHFWNLPTVEYVELHGLCIESGEEHSERIVQ